MRRLGLRRRGSGQRGLQVFEMPDPLSICSVQHAMRRIGALGQAQGPVRIHDHWAGPRAKPYAAQFFLMRVHYQQTMRAPSLQHIHSVLDLACVCWVSVTSCLCEWLSHWSRRGIAGARTPPFRGSQSVPALTRYPPAFPVCIIAHNFQACSVEPCLQRRRRGHVRPEERPHQTAQHI